MRLMFERNHTSWISKLIVFFTGRNGKIKPFASHALPIIGKCGQMTLGLSADEVMINIIDIDKYRTKGRSFRIYEIPYKNPTFNTKKFVADRNQKIYPHLELLWFIWRWFRRLFQPKWTGKNWFQYSEFCAELTSQYIMSNGYGDIFRAHKVNPNTFDAIELENFVVEVLGAKLVLEYSNP